MSHLRWCGYGKQSAKDSSGRSWRRKQRLHCDLTRRRWPKLHALIYRVFPRSQLQTFDLSATDRHVMVTIVGIALSRLRQLETKSWSVQIVIIICKAMYIYSMERISMRWPWLQSDKVSSTFRKLLTGYGRLVKSARVHIAVHANYPVNAFASHERGRAVESEWRSSSY